MRIIRAGRAQLEAVAELFDLYRQFYRRPADRALAREFIAARMTNDESVIFLALGERGDALGFTQLYLSFCSVEAIRIWILYDLYVGESARRGGVGTALLERARQHAVDSGAGRLELATAIDNGPAQRVYESLGWRRDEAFYHYALSV